MTSQPIARLDNVSKQYAARGHKVVALTGASLAVESNDYVAITGPSGSGKSTLLNILGGVDRPSDGAVFLDGERIDTLNERMLLDVRRRKIGFIFQESRLMLSLTALQNVLLPTAFWKGGEVDAKERAVIMLEKVGIGARAHHLVHELSGGEAQRVCIARALASRPRMVLADEPTGNLDHRTRMEIMLLIEQLREEERSAVVIVTHDPEVAARAKRRLTMRGGELIEDADA
ncbi:MAG: ABC transporter ATP-binding protein [Hyphomicrobiales bacterium]|nr:ABC transporter ATP-binding protein [Hyphomicrobiales bacterium]